MGIPGVSRRRFLRDAGLGATALAMPKCLRAASQKQTRPNILWIIGEDICPDLGCYGTPLVQTPRIDQLAREGVLFTHAFATAPVCSASRSAFQTGMYQTSIGAHQHRTKDKKPLPDGVRECFEPRTTLPLEEDECCDEAGEVGSDVTSRAVRRRTKDLWS